MSAPFAILSYAAAGGRLAELLPAARLEPLPAPVAHPRKARLPGLALSLARRALGDAPLDERSGVMFGTAYGCLSETAAFLENWIEREGAAPMPRAFTASVHNALASSVARELSARGECRTFVQGEVSIAQVLFSGQVRLSAQSSAVEIEGDELILGALDEWTPYVERAWQSCRSEDAPAPSEGGAVFRCSGARGGALARVSRVAMGRPRDARAWIAERAQAAPVDAWLVPDGGYAACFDPPVLETTRWTGSHPSSSASALAIGVAWLAGEVELDAPARPRSVGVLAASRFGELALVHLEASR